MAEAEKPKEPDYKKYESITDIITGKLERHVLGLEDTVVRAWADHTKGVAADKNQGDGLADKMYGAAETYITKEMLGGKLPEDPTQRRIIDNYIKETIGIEASALDDALKGRKIVHYAEAGELVEVMKKSTSKGVQKEFAYGLQGLKGEDFEPFRGYILKTATDLGLTDIKKESMPRLSEAISVYQARILPAMQERISTKKKEEERARAAKTYP